MGKSSNHRPDNVHHFISFSERISNVNVDVIHQIRRVDDESNDTCFGEALARWTDLDLTENFCTFRREISGQVQTYEQLVHHKDGIIKALKEHLSVKNTTALSALLDLLVQLAKDLQEDFVSHFQEFFTILTRILMTRAQDADAMEQTFQALASLIRVLWRFLIRDFTKVFVYYSHLLNASQKDYIKVFAAESCAYLLRKVKKKDELLNFLFSALKSSPEMTDGVGLLLFEMVKGVQKHFHTAVNEVLPLLLQKLGPWQPVSSKKSVKLPWQLVEQAVTTCLLECADYTDKENSKAIWDPLLECIDSVSQACQNEHNKSEKFVAGLSSHLCRLLRVTAAVVSHKNGAAVWDSHLIANTLCMLTTPGVSCDLLTTLSNLLDICQGSMPVDTVVKIMNSVFAAKHDFENLRKFVMACVNMPFFEKDVLPRLLIPVNNELAGGQDKCEGVMAFLTQIVLQKTGSPVAGDCLSKLAVYPLDRAREKYNADNGIVSYVMSELEELLKKTDIEVDDLTKLWAYITCLPHLSLKNPMEMCTNIWNHILAILKERKEPQNSVFQVMNQIMKSMICIAQSKTESVLPVTYEDVFYLLRCQPSNQYNVQMLDFYLSFYANSDFLTEARLQEILRCVEPNLVSPSHTMRLLTCHILSLFSFEPMDLGDEIKRESIFKEMWKAERMEPTVHTYREKLIHLRKLEHNFAIKCLPEGMSPKTCLLFVLGNEFWNFKLLWEPVGDLVLSYAVGMEEKGFWDTMLEQLERAATECEKDISSPSQESSANESPADQSSSLSVLFEDHWSHILADSRSPDFFNYRSQLWRTLKKFPEKCVLRSDQLCLLYLRFLRNEFNTTDEDAQPYQCISKSSQIDDKTHGLSEASRMPDIDSNNSVEEEKNKNVDEEMAVDDDEDNKDDVTLGLAEGKAKKIKKRSRVQSLLSHLHVFSLFKKQRAMFNQSNVQDTFYDFLKHRDGAVQKAAFDCILTYKSPHILPYKDNFLRLLDDKTFKSEITLFSIDEESSEVKAEDREGLLPVLLRILFGKMHRKTGNETAGKANSNIRRNIVFGFLSGCHPHELQYFLELLFQPCIGFVSDEPVEMVRHTKATLNLSKMIPLKRIKGMLNTIDTVSRRWGHRLGTFSHSLLHILLGLVSQLGAALDQRDQVVPGVINLLKSLRHTVVNRITQFLETFETLDFTVQEIYAIFEAVVWPQAEKLHYEGVHHPTPLLKLLLFWSQHKRFLPLLGHQHTSCVTEDSNKLVTAIECTLDLLNAPAVSKIVSNTVLEMLESILKCSDENDEDVEDDEMKTVTKMEPLPHPFVFEDTEGPGGKKAADSLLIPHIPKVLSYLKSTLGKTGLSVKDKRNSMAMEIKILANLSRLVTRTEDCNILCELLVPYLNCGASLSQDVEENTFMSLTNLMLHNAQPQVFIRPVAQLFSVIERRESRNLLCKLFAITCQNDDLMKQVASLVQRLNSWDPKRAEEPDYNVRLVAFSEVNTLVAKSEQLPVNALLPIIYNACHFIHAIDDLSIRDNSTNCLVRLVERLSSGSNGQEERRIFSSVLEQTLVPQVKLGIRSKSEAVRHEFLAVLQSLVLRCKNHPMFEGLIDLCDKDPDADFFENIKHIQMHKRSRALRRLYRHLKLHKFRATIHMSYVMPLVYSFVTSAGYAQYPGLQDAAVDVLGAVCKQLPWPHYLQTLRFYLKVLSSKTQFQRQIIRIIVALLDAFHFDLNKSTFKVKQAPKVVQNASTETDGQEESGSIGDKPEVGLKETISEKSKDEDGEDKDEAEEHFPEAHPSENDTDEKDEELVVVGGGDDSVENEESSRLFTVVCGEVAATRIHKTIAMSLIPQLHRIVTQRAKSDTEHKLAQTSKYPEDEEILRVPIALAMIKLLQSLPKDTLEHTLPGILLKICNFLRSRSRDIRSTARETLEKVTLSLGSRYLPFIIKEMRGVLTRGYQLHVLTFTVHYLLKSLLEFLQPGDLDPALNTVQEVFYAELFGHVAEEKEVEAIKAKYFEAKFIKGYDAYGILARFVSASKLENLILPVKNVLETTSSQRIANKAETLLQKVATGLAANASIPLEAMMVFIHNLVSLTSQYQDNLEQERNKDKQWQSKEGQQGKNMKKIPESCLILEEVAPRGGIKPKLNKKTNSHLLIEFGLQLLHNCLKKQVLLQTEQSHLQMLDPLVPRLKTLLSDNHAKTSANTMRCLSWILQFPLPSLKKNMKDIASGMFVMLQSYAGASTAKGGNQELITMCFKTVTVLVRDVPYYQITPDKLQVLLTYCEEDLYSFERQSTAFGLIRAILSRKVDTPQFHQVMERLFEMAITSSAGNLRLQCRQVILHYLMNYPHGKSLKKHLQFFIDHLEYEMDDGRKSSIEMMISMFTTFPTKILNNHCPRFFTALAMASFNDNDAGCRKLIYVALKTLIGKIDIKCRKSLFTNIVTWLKSEDLRVRAMSCQVCGLFVEVEGGKFQHYVMKVLPLLQQQMEPGRYAQGDEAEQIVALEGTPDVEQKDVCLLAVLNLTLKIVRELGVVTEPRFAEDFDQIWDHVRSHLVYPHIQVRLVASQLLGLMLSAREPGEVIAQHQQQQQQPSGEVIDPVIDNKNEGTSEWKESHCILISNPMNAMRKFATSICQQLKSPSLDDLLATQAVKILLYLSRLAEAADDMGTLTWLAKKVIKEINMEVIKNVKITIRRNHLLKWIAAVGVTLQPSSVEKVLPVVLPPLQREISEQAQDQDLKNLAQEVVDLLKKQVGLETFTFAYASSQKWRLEKRELSKRRHAEEAVTNPEIAAVKKIKHNLKKRETRKRKIMEKKTNKRVKKSKLSILNVKVDEDD